jgi:hypothetical protein
MSLLDRIRKASSEEPSAPIPLDQVRETLATEPARRPFPGPPANEPAWIRAQREARERAGGRLVATKEISG